MKKVNKSRPWQQEAHRHFPRPIASFLVIILFGIMVALFLVSLPLLAVAILSCYIEMLFERVRTSLNVQGTEREGKDSSHIQNHTTKQKSPGSKGPFSLLHSDSEKSSGTKKQKQRGAATRVLLTGLLILWFTAWIAALVTMALGFCTTLVSLGAFAALCHVLPHTYFQDCFKNRVLAPTLEKACNTIEFFIKNFEEKPEFQKRLSEDTTFSSVLNGVKKNVAILKEMAAELRTTVSEISVDGAITASSPALQTR